ncbi:protein CURVATURE THYLAKOID 1A [Striga asiatica]|uniref:Protein CURVATURE THYLAKOID 1A n=1 Tax=Striga asiatica TaxID=4170 RepID=A0A5A7QMG8_STRAF|nr:protein CURVATURE THYLAKOID 1A [Striga asiatica]
MPAAASTSMAATAVLIHRLPARKGVVFSPLPNRPSPFSHTSLKQLKVLKASSSEETPLDTNELLTADRKYPWPVFESSSSDETPVNANEVLTTEDIKSAQPVIDSYSSNEAPLVSNELLTEDVKSSQASSSDETPLDPNELSTYLKEKWDVLENKPAAILYGSGAIVAVWLASIVVGAVDSVPLLPKILELVGLGYSGWFAYRYLLFESSRKELATDIDALKKNIFGPE